VRVLTAQSGPAHAAPSDPPFPAEEPVLPPVPAPVVAARTHSKPVAQSESVLHSLALAVPTVTVVKKATIEREKLVSGLDILSLLVA